MTTLPDYVRRPGDIVGAPPYRAEGCLLQAMLVKGDRALQQQHVDLVLNRPANGAWVFHVLSDFLLLNAVYVDTMRSLDPIDGQKGTMGETDVGFWSAVHGGPTDRPDLWSLYWLPSFLYVDTASAMSSGREIYGYPKTAATITRGAGGSIDPGVEIHALHMPGYGPAERPQFDRLLRISAPTGPLEATPVEDGILAAWAALKTAPPGFEGKAAPPSAAVMPQILLRQLRDPFRLGRASLQEGLVAEPRPLAVRGMGFLQSGATLEITPSMSHPVAEALGVAATSPVKGFWIEQDFELGAARLLWSQP